MCAESSSIISQSLVVSAVAYIGPEYPLATSKGIFPEWSMCACVSNMQSISFVCIGISQFS